MAEQVASGTGATYNYQQALDKIQQATGQTLSPDQISRLFQQFGGDQNSTFTDATLAPVIASLNQPTRVDDPNAPRPTPIPLPNPNNPNPNVDQFGNPITPYTSDPNAPQYTPMANYTPPTWQGGASPDATPLAQYSMPTLADLQNSPGYQARLSAGEQGQQRSAAAQGSVLNGGELKALDQFDQGFASNEYSNLVNQTMAADQLNNSATQTGNQNAFQSYLANYGQFTDAANMGFQANNQNFNQGQTAYQNQYGAYLNNNSRTLQDYLTNQATKRNSENDYWSRLMDLNNTGANAANGSYKFTTLS